MSLFWTPDGSIKLFETPTGFFFPLVDFHATEKKNDPTMVERLLTCSRCQLTAAIWEKGGFKSKTHNLWKQEACTRSLRDAVTDGTAQVACSSHDSPCPRLRRLEDA